MAQITVLDSTGATQTVAKVLNTGSTSDANSFPVSLSTEDKATLASVATGTGRVLPAGTDRSGTLTTGGTAQQLAAQNTARTALRGQNISASDLWINEIGGTAAVDAAGSYKIPAGSTFTVSTNRAISIVGGTTGQKWTATEV